MATCPKCGAFVDNNAKFCNICGQAMPNIQPANYASNGGYTQPTYQAQPTYTQQSYAPNVPQSSITENNLPPEFKPISAWGYVGYNLLFSIPLIGFIFLIVYACGGTQNKNLKNYARSFFCILLLSIIISVILGILGIVFGMNLGDYLNQLN